MYEDAWLSSAVSSRDMMAGDAAKARQAVLTKPAGSLGRLEEMAVFLASCQGRECPEISNPHILIFAADHGIVEEGVSAFPAEVTTQMMLNFLNGGAAISVLAHELGAKLSVIDVGSLADDMPDGIVTDRVAKGSKNFRHAQALTREELLHAFSAGQRAVMRSLDAQADILIPGEMGIGNTSAAAAVAAGVTGRFVEDICGPGTGLTAEGVKQKAAILRAALKHHGLSGENDPLDVLLKVGGHEIAALCGSFIAAAQAGCPVLVDGFICSVAALAAVKINPGARDWLIFSHKSAEPGHGIVLDALEAKPLLDLGMRLGEGSGASVALPLLKLACRLHSGMATFESAGVSAGEGK